MADKIICNKSDLTAVADAVRSKLGVTDTYYVSELSAAIDSIPTGTQLPTLTNPGTASDLLSGKELIDQDGNKITGTIQNKSATTYTPTTTDQIIDSGVYLTGAQTIKGDSNLTADNIKSGTSIFGITGSYEGSSPNLQSKSVTYTSNGTATVTPDSGYDGLSSVDVTVDVASGGGSGNTDFEDSFVTRTISTYTNDRVTTVGSYAFHNCTSLTNVSFPVCSNINGSAFYNCTNLTTMSFPACTSIGLRAFCDCTSLTNVSFPVCSIINDYAFYSCSKLTTISFPACKSIGMEAFYSCSSLTNVSFPACMIIGIRAFNKCTSLTNVSFPVCSNIQDSAFYNCTKLTTISFPACTIIGVMAFYNCSSLTNVSFPVCSNINGSAFYNCTSLTNVSFPACTSIGIRAFNKCSRLSSIYLMNSAVCRLTNSNAFISTSIKSTTGSIFVPASLVSSYKTATNWAYFSNRIFGV